MVQGPDHADVGLVCQEMAVLMERTKRLPQARDLLQRCLDIRTVSTWFSPHMHSEVDMHMAKHNMEFETHAW